MMLMSALALTTAMAMATATATATAAPPPRAAVLVRATGLADADAARLDEQVNAEIAAHGFEAVRIGDADPACLSARACARDLVRSAAAVALARIDLVRGGGNVQIAAVVFDDEGRASEEVTGLARLSSLLGGGAVLPPALWPLLLARKPAIAAPVEKPRAAEKETPAAVVPVAAHPSEARPPEARPPEARPPEVVSGGDPVEAQPSGVALAAIGGIGVGALAVAVGAVGATGQVGVARDPAALGTDKERAAVLVPVLVAVALAGAALAGVSGWILVGELD